MLDFWRNNLDRSWTDNIGEAYTTSINERIKEPQKEKTTRIKHPLHKEQPSLDWKASSMVTDFVLLEEGTRNIATVHVETDDKQRLEFPDV